MKCFYCDEEFNYNENNLDTVGKNVHKHFDHRFQQTTYSLYFDLIIDYKIIIILAKRHGSDYFVLEQDPKRKFLPEQLNKQVIDKLKNIYTLLK